MMSKKLFFELVVVACLVGVAVLLSQIGVAITGLVTSIGLIVFITLSSRINLVAIARSLGLGTSSTISSGTNSGTAESAH